MSRWENKERECTKLQLSWGTRPGTDGAVNLEVVGGLAIARVTTTADLLSLSLVHQFQSQNHGCWYCQTQIVIVHIPTRSRSQKTNARFQRYMERIILRDIR